MPSSDLPILYSFRRCPYAMRARMAVAAADIQSELREVVLRDKPQEMIDISPKATVPVLQLPDGTVIDESIDIMRWALAQNDPEGWLALDDAIAKEAFELIEQTETQFKPELDRYKYPNRYSGAQAQTHRAEGAKFVDRLEARLQATPYLCGDQACIADFAIFPFIRQFANTDRDWFDAAPWPHTQAWLEKLIGSAHFTGVMNKYPQWHAGDEIALFP
jgi:glutathione S-transferase